MILPFNSSASHFFRWLRELSPRAPSTAGTKDDFIALAPEKNSFEPPPRDGVPVPPTPKFTPSTKPREFRPNPSWTLQFIHGLHLARLDGATAVGACGRTVIFKGATTSQELGRVEHASRIECLATGSGITVSGDVGGTLVVSDSASGKCQRKVMAHPGGISSVAVDEQSFVTGGMRGGTVKIWSRASDTCVVLETGTPFAVNAVCLTPNYVVASVGKAVKVWDRANKQLRGVLVGHRDVVSSLDVRGATLLSCTDAGFMRAWDLETLTCLRPLDCTDDVMGVAVLSNDFVVGAGLRGKLEVHNLSDGALLRSLDTGSTSVVDLVSIPGGILSAGSDGRVRAWHFSV